MATTPEAEEFAAMLRRLKERSGHSYGVLAGRLHVSTSTLHRYCNGDAVPAEFAVVERLARLCAAEREELLALHRRWILADEARLRAREAARGAAPAATGHHGPGPVASGGPGPGPATGAGAVPASGPASGSGPGTAAVPGDGSASGAAPGPAAEAGPTGLGSTGTGPAEAGPTGLGSTGTGPAEAGPTGLGSTGTGPAEAGPSAATGSGPDGVPSVAPGTGSASGGEPAVAAGSGPDGEPRSAAASAAGDGPRSGGGHARPGPPAPVAQSSPVPAASGAGEAAEVEGEEVSGPERAAPSARGKRLVVALAAAAVVALAVPAALVASHSGTSGDRAAGAATSAPASRTRGSEPAPSAPASRPPSVKPSPSASSGASVPPPVSPPARHGAPAQTGTPLRVGVSSYNWDSPCGQYYLLGRAPAEIPPAPPPQDHRSWARALDGVDAGGMRLQLTATGKTRDSVVITAVHVRIVGRAEPLAWNAYSMGEGCGSGVTPQTFDVDLDKPRPVLRPVAGRQGDITVPATDFPYKVASNDPQVFNLHLHTASHDVRWYVEVEWSSGDRRGTLRIDDEGRPFRTSALQGRPLYDYRPDLGGIWAPREE